MRCNICGGPDFLDMPKRPAVRCARCGSLERTRVAALHIAELGLEQGARILHFAPERGLSALLREKGGANYRALDIDPDQFRLLTADYDDPLLVLGGAGCGKTTIALHRIAYLRFKDPAHFPSHKILVVVPEEGLVRLSKKLLAWISQRRKMGIMWKRW